MRSFAPQPWDPPADHGLRGPFEDNDRLAAARLVEVGAEGPEDVVVGDDGLAFTGTADGWILSVASNGSINPLVELGGRPLGVELYGDDLLVCNADLGLQLVTRKGSFETLADDFLGRRFRFTNNAAVSEDGTIYFTDTSTRWGIAEYVNDLLEGQGTGRLFRRSSTGEVTKVADGFHFANGVALDPDGTSVFVAETGRYRVHRHWLAGPRAGETDLFVDSLPGFPDNLTFGNDTLWVSLASPRQKVIDVMGPRPWMKHVSYRLPEVLKPKPLRHGIVLGYDIGGQLVHNLQDGSGRVAITTSARFFDGSLYIGSLSEPHIAVYELE